jgi:hypothetical protein
MVELELLKDGEQILRKSIGTTDKPQHEYVWVRLFREGDIYRIIKMSGKTVTVPTRDNKLNQAWIWDDPKQRVIDVAVAKHVFADPDEAREKFNELINELKPGNDEQSGFKIIKLGEAKLMSKNHPDYVNQNENMASEDLEKDLEVLTQKINETSALIAALYKRMSKTTIRK